MWRRVTPQLRRFAAAYVSSMSSSSSSFRPNINLLSARSGFKSSIELEAGYFNHHGTQYSTTVPNDPDTHDDFKPANKLQNLGLSLKDVVEQDVKDNPVMIYMKGVPEVPRCGFSALAVRVLKEYALSSGLQKMGVPLSARNILEDPELKNAVKAHSHWPTFPQIFIKGEFIGGSDIILSMHQNGELEEKLKDVTTASRD